ncbi:MAG: metallophosphoesterase family protein, partial [Chlorobi bacterium]|nr:metallophosphoesterase family protein [Chlorobiota bacterium]
MTFTKKTVSYLFFTTILFPALLTLNAQSLTKGPYLADPGSTSITIRWESNSQADFVVRYGEDETLERSKEAKFISKKKSGYLYEANLTDLTPGGKYFYRVTSDKINSEVHTFKNGVSRNEPFCFVVLGDSRSKPNIFKAITDQIIKIDPTVIIANGDLVAKGGNYDNWQSQFFDPAKEMINHIPFITAVGDHESDKVDGDNADLFTHFLFPHKDSLKLWFSYDIGNAHFTFLDWRYPYSNEMIEWFKKDISSSDKDWKFVIMHRPVYNLGGHRTAWGKNVWSELLREYKIDIVFAGHSHLYERFYPLRPLSQPDAWAVTYITTGGAGASLYEAVQNRSLAFS